MRTQDVLKDLHTDGRRERRMRNQTTHKQRHTHAYTHLIWKESKQQTHTVELLRIILMSDK